MTKVPSMGLPLAAALAMTTAPGLDLDEVPRPNAVILQQRHEPGVRVEGGKNHAA